MCTPFGLEQAKKYYFVPNAKIHVGQRPNSLLLWDLPQSGSSLFGAYDVCEVYTPHKLSMWHATLTP